MVLWKVTNIIFLTPSGLQKWLQMGINFSIRLKSKGQLRMGKPRKAKRARAKLSILDTAHKSPPPPKQPGKDHPDRVNSATLI